MGLMIGLAMFRYLNNVGLMIGLVVFTVQSSIWSSVLKKKKRVAFGKQSARDNSAQSDSCNTTTNNNQEDVVKL